MAYNGLRIGPVWEFETVLLSHDSKVSEKPSTFQNFIPPNRINTLLAYRAEQRGDRFDVSPQLSTSMAKSVEHPAARGVTG